MKKICHSSEHAYEENSLTRIVNSYMWPFGLVGVLIALFVNQAMASQLVDEAKQTYDQQLDEYRADYAEFLLKREQFEEIDSFANQEELVAASQEMLKERSHVWWSYWQALRTELVEAEGFDGDIQAELTTQMVEAQEDVKEHEERLSVLDTREDLLDEAQWLNDKNIEYRNIAFESLTHLRLARFNWAVTQLEAYVPVLQENINIQIRDPQLKATKLRGVGEVELLLEQSRDILNTTMEEELGRRVLDFEDVYEDVEKSLSKGYTALRRAESVLTELSTGTEL